MGYAESLDGQSGEPEWLFLVGVGCEEGGDAGGLVEIDDRAGGKVFVDCADLAQGAIDGAGTDVERLNGVLHGADLSLHLGHEGFEGAELFFGALQDVPDLVAFFLDGKHVETHLEAGEDSG